ncbi:hypothetical protein WJX84_008501 [Apatococcus fuscideae]|uniref:OTU domain-containing protein n=1 Tax=Apatococcus fuscideae TaxID=2026836 RepID=A0AAW1SUE7_9CHLO
MFVPKSSLQTSHPEWSRIRVRGDGNCLFRALAQGSHRLSAGSENALPEAEERQAAAQLRRAICEELRNHQADIEPFLEGNFGAYVRRMESEATWGGEPELAVAPHCLQRPINVFTQRLLGPLEQISSYGDQYKPAAALAGPCQAAAQDRSQADLDRSFQMAQESGSLDLTLGVTNSESNVKSGAENRLGSSTSPLDQPDWPPVERISFLPSLWLWRL